MTKFISLGLAILFLGAAPATRPAAAERFVVEVKMVSFDAAGPAPRPDAALATDATELWRLETTAQPNVPYACSAVIGATTYKLAGTFRRMDDGSVMGPIEYGESSVDSNGGVSTATATSNVVLKLDRPQGLATMGGVGPGKWRGFVVTLKSAGH